MRNLFRVLSLAVFMLVLAVTSAFAAGITSSSIDYNTSQMTITGTGFPLNRPIVRIYGPTVYSSASNAINSLSVVANTRTSIIVQLPVLQPGTYKVTVGNSLGLIGTFDFTYGAAGVSDVTALTTGLNTANINIAANTTAINNLSASMNTANSNIATNTSNIAANTGAISDESARANGAEDSLKTKVDGLQVAVNGPAMQAALMQWYPVTYNAGSKPETLAFDGANVWIANYNANTVTVLNAATGKPATLSGNSNPISVGSGSGPFGIAFDGTNMWVCNYNVNTVSEINASTGAVVNPAITVGTNPDCVAFDGANIWVGNYSDGTVSEIDPSTGAPASSPVTGRTRGHRFRRHEHVGGEFQ